MVTLVAVAVRRHDAGRLSLPSGVPWPNGLGVAAVGYAWAELTTDTRYQLRGPVIHPDRAGRFVLPTRSLRTRFLPAPELRLLVLVFRDPPDTHVVTADTEYLPHLMEATFWPPGYHTQRAWHSPWR